MVFCCSFGTGFAGFAGFYVVQMLVCCCSFGTAFLLVLCCINVGFLRQFWRSFGVGFMMYKCWFFAAVLVLFLVGFMLYKCWFMLQFWCWFGVVLILFLLQLKCF